MKLRVIKTWHTSEMIEVPDYLSGPDLRTAAMEKAGLVANQGHLWEGTKIVDKDSNELVNYTI